MEEKLNKNVTADLMIAIINFVNDQGGYISKTKLIKYLYLIDLEYYRINKKTLTGFNWFYYKFGPFAREFENIYDELEKGEYINVKSIANFDYDAKILSSDKKIGINETITEISFRLIVRNMLSRWSKEKLAQMLDYVYFETEPMDSAVKNQPLDFSDVKPISPAENARVRYPKIKSNKINKIKESIAQKLAQQKKGVRLDKLFPPENYDEKYWDDLINLDWEES